MLRVSSLFALVLLFAAIPAATAAPFSIRSHLYRRFSTLAAPSPTSICSPDFGCLPEGFPVPDPSTVHFIQFPNGVTVNLEGYGQASLPFGYPVSALPSYDSATNTVKDPVEATVLAWYLSTAANPNFNGNNWGGWTIPGVGTGMVGGGGVGAQTGGEVITGGENPVESSSGGSENGAEGSESSNSSTGLNGNGNQSGSSAGHNGGASASTGGNTHVSGGSTGASNNNNNNNNNGGSKSPNGAAVLTSSVGLVAGLAVATVFAAFF